MNGSATVNTNNDVYLPSSKYITVTGALGTSAGALNITPVSMVNGTVLVTYGSLLIPDTWNANFALNPTWANQYSFNLVNSSTDLLLVTNCTVRFYNETHVVYTTQYVSAGSIITEPSPTPTKTGYTFSGWNNTTSGNNTPWNFSTNVVTVNPTNLSANWTVNTTPTPTPTATMVPTSSSGGGGGNDGNNADSGPVSLNLHYPAGSSVIVTVFKNYFNRAAAPSGISYLNVYDVHSTAAAGTLVTLVFRVDASELEAKGLTPEDVSILHYYDGEWHKMTITSIELVDGVYQFTITSTHTSPFMVAYDVDQFSFPIEETATTTPTSTPTTGPTVIFPTSTTTPTETPSSPVPLVGIIAGLGAVTLLLRRR